MSGYSSGTLLALSLINFLLVIDCLLAWITSPAGTDRAMMACDIGCSEPPPSAFAAESGPSPSMPEDRGSSTDGRSGASIVRRGAMERALSIPEIARKIFSSYSIFLDRPTLVSLSITNRTFHEYALDAVWGHVRGVSIFCRILFPDAGTKYSRDRLISIARNSWSSRTERFQAFCSEREVREPNCLVVR